MLLFLYFLYCFWYIIYVARIWDLNYLWELFSFYFFSDDFAIHVNLKLSNFIVPGYADCSDDRRSSRQSMYLQICYALLDGLGIFSTSVVYVVDVEPMYLLCYTLMIDYYFGYIRLCVLFWKGL